MEKFGIEIKKSKPSFFGFLFSKCLFLKKKLFKGYLEVGFCGKRAEGGGEMLHFINQGLSGLDFFFLILPKCTKFHLIREAFV